MRKRLIWEILFSLIAIITSLFVFHFAFGLTNFGTESVIDIDVYDTYFVIQKRELFPLFSLIFLYVSYFAKICIQKFKNRQSLWIFSIISLITILIYPSILSFVKSLSTEPGWVVYPPLSAEKVEIKENIFTRIYPKIYYSYIITTLFNAFVFFKLGRLYYKHKL